MSWMDEMLKEMYKDSAFLTSRQLKEAKDNGYVKDRCKENWYIGKTVDLYGSSNELGFTGTVSEIYPDGYCMIEVW